MAANRDVPGHRVPAFSPSVDVTTSFLRNLPPSKTYRPHTRFIEQGQIPKSIHLIHSGIVKITHTNSTGHETTVGLRSQGWWMCASVAIAQVNSLATVVAVTDASVSSISIEAFKSALGADPILREHFLTTQSRELLMMEQYIIMQGVDAATRFRTMHSEAKSSAWNIADLSPILKQSEVAALLAITPEHLSRLKSKRAADK